MDASDEGEYHLSDGDLFNRDTAKVMAFFLLVSMGMFTLPFAAFYGARHVLVNTLNVEGFAVTAWSVFAAVLTVNAIILVYAYKGYHEDVAEQTPAVRRSQRSQLNAKDD